MERQTFETIELSDIQGFLVRGYKRMQYSRYLLMQVTDAAAAKKWMHTVAAQLTTGVHHPSTDHNIDTCINLAFTAPGLQALGLDDDNLQNFTREFREGMTTPHRQRLLGDAHSSAPTEWNWGGPNNETVHMMVMLFAAKEQELKDYYAETVSTFTTGGLKEIMHIDGQNLEEGREHFGFRDGMGQPVIEGSGRKGPEEDIIETGEFIMGYKNEYGVFPDTPYVTTPQGNLNLLDADAGGSGYKDLGRNGSYLVFRQLKQDVCAFWNFMNQQTKKEDGSVDVTGSTRLASKMIGRWPSGAPLVKFPDADPGFVDNDNSWSYHKLDKEGAKCPFGSHIRRVNPRDNFEDNGIKESLTLSKRHRILRRGKLYGQPIVAGPLNCDVQEEVGLLFVCFNADISRQYEFIQYTWANYPKFKQLYNDPDPIIGVADKPRDGVQQNFTIQEKPASRTVNNLQRFVQVRGGAYFFSPSLTAVRYLATL
jgi:Dyp-type peroxidase family